MTHKQIKNAKKALDDYTERYQVASDGTGHRDGLILTAYFTGGGQAIFHARRAVDEWLQGRLAT